MVQEHVVSSIYRPYKDLLVMLTPSIYCSLCDIQLYTALLYRVLFYSELCRSNPKPNATLCSSSQRAVNEIGYLCFRAFQALDIAERLADPYFPKMTSSHPVYLRAPPGPHCRHLPTPSHSHPLFLHRLLPCRGSSLCCHHSPGSHSRH